MKLLFMGGPADGKWIDVPRDREFWRVAADGDLMSETMSFRVAEYRKFPLRGHSYTFNVMVVEGMDSDSVVGNLVRGYLAFRTDEKAKTNETKELLVDPKKLDAENLLDRMAEVS